MNERPEKSRFGDLLLEMRLVEEGELASAMAERAQTGRRLEQVLVDRRVIDEDRLTKAVAAQLNLETVSLDGHRTHAQVLARVPPHVARTFGVLPYAIKRTARSEILFLVMSDPLDTVALSEVHRHSGCQVRVMLAGVFALEKAIHNHYGPITSERLVDLSEDVIPLEEADFTELPATEATSSASFTDSDATNGKAADKTSPSSLPLGRPRTAGKKPIPRGQVVVNARDQSRIDPSASAEGLPPFGINTAPTGSSKSGASWVASLSENPTEDMSGDMREALSVQKAPSPPVTRRKPKTVVGPFPSSSSEASPSPGLLSGGHTEPRLSSTDESQTDKEARSNLNPPKRSSSFFRDANNHERRTSPEPHKIRDAWSAESRLHTVESAEEVEDVELVEPVNNIENAARAELVESFDKAQSVNNVEKVDKWAAKSILHRVGAAWPASLATPPALPASPFGRGEAEESDVEAKRPSSSRRARSETPVAVVGESDVVGSESLQELPALAPDDSDGIIADRDLRRLEEQLAQFSSLALEVPVDLVDDRNHPFQPLQAFDVPVGLEETGIIPEVDLDSTPFEPPPPDSFPADPQARRALSSDDIPKSLKEISVRRSGIEVIELMEPIQVAPMEDGSSLRIDVDEVRSALLQGGIGGTPPDVDDLVADGEASRPEPTTSVYSLDEGQPPSLPEPAPVEDREAERLVSALEEGASLTAADRAQLVLALGRLMLAAGVVERDALVRELERSSDT
ncbi:MAG: hypothetical protein KTR25_10040 [Myxococcales bacterium]|nr:hypothetical protein [Myxococcales bacterium]